ncbi:sporulation integral membrane protein YtvI [Vulcanibacillus modesticaldus]|uniref:Sporulation integral membrane protein YtvI n=1 Tax=Vulcanibacillus modesticaldus TaxID=337097 RepID=A0A1D2YTU1_9BACI|nr:sporulation integral membrane protein YtvI [Vulcanibacillus modesticaldus]OEF99096.1 sporulation integral membrane protein YtvI [Vulcanibacillus modesticaldus]
MLTFYKKYGRTAFDIFLIIVTVYLIMYLFSMFYNIGKPIFWGLVIFLMIEPLAKFFHKKGLKKIVATTIATLIFIIIIFVIVITLGVIFTSQIYHLAETLPNYVSNFHVEIINKADYFLEQIQALSPGLIEEAQGYLVTVGEKSSKFLKNILLGLFYSLTSISSFMVNFVVGLILAFFLSIEINEWKRLAKEKVPKTFKNAYIFLKDNVIEGILAYLKAQLKLIGFTFLIIFIGLLILGIDSAFSISLLAAILDLLPLLGVSTLFIPWIIYLFIFGKTSTAISLSVILSIVIIFRQIAEPKITGESLGVSAFTMLSFMVISLSLFGIAGIILSPILLILIKALYDQGYLRRWIHLPKDEF